MPNYRPLQDQQPIVENVDVLRQRVFTLERGQDSIRTELSEFRSAVAKGFDDLRTDFSRSVQERSPKLTGIISVAGFALTLLIFIGGMAYAPIKTTTDNLATEVAILRSQLVSRQDLADKDSKVYAALEKLERRGENNAATKLDKEVYTSAHQDIQRQVTELRHLFGSAYSLQDGLKDIQSRLNRVEAEALRSSRSTKAE